MNTNSNVIDFKSVKQERQHEWEDEYATYLIHMLIDEFLEEWDFSNNDQDYMKQFVRDMTIMREDVMAVIRRLNGEHHEQHQFMDEYWEMIDNPEEYDDTESDEPKQ